MTDIPGDFGFQDTIAVAAVFIAIAIGPKGLPARISSMTAINMAIRMARRIRKLSRCRQRNGTELQRIIGLFPTQGRHFRRYVLRQGFDFIGQVFWHRLGLGLILSLDDPLGHLHAAVWFGPVGHSIEITHGTQFFDIAIVRAVYGNIGRRRWGCPSTCRRAQGQHQSRHQSRIHLLHTYPTPVHYKNQIKDIRYTNVYMQNCNK